MSFKQKIGKFLIPKLPISRETFDILRFELNAYRVNLTNKFNPFVIVNRRKYTKKDNVSLNIAAGPFGEKDYINIDIFNHKNISFCYDCRKKIPFRNNTVSRIRAEHFFEHINNNDEALQFLKECNRVLKKDAVLRIIVPDVSKFIYAYFSNKEEDWNRIGFSTKNWESPIHILNHVFRQNGEHKFGYDFYSLKKLIEQFNFKVHFSEYRNSIDSKLNNDQENHSPYSLYLDCEKK